jgi:excisionase family DNA binding protein
MSELIKIADAAKRLGVSRSTAYAMAQRGELPGLVRVGRMPRVSVRHLDAWIDQRANRPDVA